MFCSRNFIRQGHKNIPDVQVAKAKQHGLLIIQTSMFYNKFGMPLASDTPIQPTLESSGHVMRDAFEEMRTVGRNTSVLWRGSRPM